MLSSPLPQLTAPGQLEQLGSLVVGMKTETFLTLTPDRLLSSLPAMAQQTPGLSPTQANAISTKLWVSHTHTHKQDHDAEVEMRSLFSQRSSPSQSFPEVVGWLDEVEPLLGSTPLLSVQARTPLLVNNVTSTSTRPWNTQQVPPEAGRGDECRYPCHVVQSRTQCDNVSASILRLKLYSKS